MKRSVRRITTSCGSELAHESDVSDGIDVIDLIVPTLRVVTPIRLLCGHCDAERHEMHAHAERGNDHETVHAAKHNILWE